MSLVHQAAKPSVAILKHGNDKGILMIYKIAVRDGKERERNGKMFAFYFDNDCNGNVKEIDMREILDYEPSSNSALFYDKSDITKNKELVDVYADKYVNDLLGETAPRLAEIEYKTEESIVRHYSTRIEDINTKINEYDQKLTESPNYSRLIPLSVYLCLCGGCLSICRFDSFISFIYERVAFRCCVYFLT
jgi:hypothetical protein